MVANVYLSIQLSTIYKGECQSMHGAFLNDEEDCQSMHGTFLNDEGDCQSMHGTFFNDEGK